MILKMWAANRVGESYDEREVSVDSLAEASAELVSELFNTASDEFLHKALTEWFTTGKIDNLDEGNDHTWNATLS